MKKYICRCENMCMHVYLCSTLCWSVYVYNVYMIIDKIHVYLYKLSWIYVEDWRRRSLLLNGFLKHILTVCIMSLWKAVRWQSVAPVSFKYSWILQGRVFDVWESKTRKLWIHLWVNGYLGLVDLRKCMLIPHNPPGSLCLPTLGTPGIAMKVGSRLIEWLSRASVLHFVSNLRCLVPNLEVSKFTELLWPLSL